MFVICEECGLKYQIDPSKIIGDKARFKCRGCSTSIVVDKRDHLKEEEIVALEDALLTGSTPVEETMDGLGEIEEIPVEVSAVEEVVPEVATVVPVVEKKKRTGMGLTAKVTFLMLLVSLIPGGVYFALSFKQTSDQIVTESTKNGVVVTKLLAEGVDEWLDKNVRALNAVAKFPGIVSMNQQDQETYLKALQREYPWIYLVFTTNEKGLNVARSDGNKLLDYSNRQYVKDIVGGADLAWQNLIGKTSNKPALVLAVPIKDGQITIGVLAAAMTRDAMSQVVTNFRQGETGSSFLVDQTGKAVAHQNNAFVLQQQNMSSHPLVKAAQKGAANRIEFVDANGKETIGFAQKTKLGWTLAIQQDKSESFEPLARARKFALALFAVTVGAILVIAYFSSRAIVDPIKKLTDAANRISIGDLEVEINRTSKDEIGELGEAIMRMQDSIRLSLSRLKRRRRR